MPTVVSGPVPDAGAAGGWDCCKNIVYIDPRRTQPQDLCITIIHEMMHAMDYCDGWSKCTCEEGVVDSCKNYACREIRAYATSGYCCSYHWGNPRHRPPPNEIQIRKCVRFAAADSIRGMKDKSGKTCGSDDVNAAMDECYPKDLSCTNPIVRIPGPPRFSRR